MAMSKYNATRTQCDGYKFASKREASRYMELKLMERAGIISDLRLQVPFDITINGFHVCTYIADATYVEKGKPVVEDTKGMLTPVYKLKRRLMRAVHNVEILEV